MRTLMRPAASLLPLALFACGDDGAPAVDAPDPDAYQIVDAAGAPDADPMAPDAVPGAFDCNGIAPPSTGIPDPIMIEGTTEEIAASGTTPVTNVTLDAFEIGNPTPVATATSMGSTATFALTIPTGTMSVDGYIRGTFPPDGAEPRLTSYVFPPTPLYQSVMNVLVASVTPTTVSTINLLLPGDQDDQQDGNGAVGILVTDCLGNPLEGAVVTATGGMKVLYRDATGFPDVNAMATGPDGVGIVLNVPPGKSVTVDAGYQGYNMREHVVEVRTIGAPDNSLTTTIVTP